MIKNFIRDERGSLTLEAAMVMPFFLLFVVFLATIIRISVADMALKQAVSETTEIFATSAYPIAVASGAAETKANSKIEEYTNNKVQLGDVKTLLNFVFDSVGFDPTSYFQDAAESASTEVVKTKYKESNADLFFSGDNIQVEITDLPDPNSTTSLYLGMIATYELEITAPFVNKTIVLKEKAYERIWVGS
ncbi:TadE/TadG family type IV pilus assembly protein [Alkalicoccobacillus plakortidis]|uniref:Pilus assembly protein n=1 Tax=Alkalicoccobacillus plakortidis TaxID=444060 RepID=A0ABT0XMJ3_9BACI|nr:TadE family protein [Alkalicoccobacillus plakortidis]MCM2677124.1 pilus assembly protein [Alkalicoccobacillus plakortidis]